MIFLPPQIKLYFLFKCRQYPSLKDRRPIDTILLFKRLKAETLCNVISKITNVRTSVQE